MVTGSNRAHRRLRGSPRRVRRNAGLAVDGRRGPRLATVATRSRFSAPSVLRGFAALVSLVVAMCASGCITVDGTLAGDGSGKVVVGYAVPPGATEASQRLLLASQGITVESLTIGVDRMLSATLSFADLAAVGTIPVFTNTTVRQTAEGDDRVLTIVVNKLPKMPAGETAAGPRIRLTLPGDVVEANANAVVEGEHVEWRFSLADWTARPAWELRARYRPRVR